MTRLRSAASWTAVALLLGTAVVLIGWRAHGGSWVRVETPSMGTTAPVGSLLWVEPVEFDDLREGDLISFQPPGSRDTYSHLVAGVNADGTVETQGLLSGKDPWRLGPEQVRGRSAWVVPGLGWLVLALPVLVPGALVVWMLLLRLRDRSWRVPLGLVGSAVVVAAAVVVYRPLLGAEQLSFEVDSGTARATYVGTGLLPVRLANPEGASVVLGPGEVGAVTTQGAIGPADASRYHVDLGPAIPGAWWAGLVLVCFLPALVDTQRRRAARPWASRRSPAAPRHLAVH